LPLAIRSAKRVPDRPEVSTISEAVAELAGFEARPMPPAETA
jgi:hypothetical protein